MFAKLTRDLLLICAFVAIGLTTSLGLAVAFSKSTALVASFAQLG
jgi:hypothetical protein